MVTFSTNTTADRRFGEFLRNVWIRYPQWRASPKRLQQTWPELTSWVAWESAVSIRILRIYLEICSIAVHCSILWKGDWCYWFDFKNKSEGKRERKTMWRILTDISCGFLISSKRETACKSHGWCVTMPPAHYFGTERLLTGADMHVSHIV